MQGMPPHDADARQPTGRREAWLPAALVAVLVAVVFGGYEFFERRVLAEAGARLLHDLHILRGVASSVAAAALVAWCLARRRRVALPVAPVDIVGHGLGASLSWFTRLRWLALAGVTAAVFVSCHALGLLPPEVAPPLWAGVAALLAANILFERRRAGVGDARSFLLCQIAFDIVLLTYFLHFSGGLENPLFFLYVFHVILAGILLAPRDAWAVTGAAVALRLAVGIGEASGLLDHYTLSVFPHFEHEGQVEHAAKELRFVLATSAAFTGLLCGAAFFTTAIMQRLRESQAALLRQERLSTLGRLAAFVAHETANPIGIISARAKLMRARADQATAFFDESLEVIERQAERVIAVMRSLLGYAKPHAGVPARIMLNAALTEALSIAQGRLDATRIRLEKRLAADLPPVRAGSSEVVHVFLNIINNAADAMPHGGLLRVATRRVDGWVEATVSDSGAGIPPGDQDRIFEPFFTTKPPEAGSGLGLPICRSLARACGGDIVLEAGAGRGATFRIRLPAAEAP